MVSTSSGGGDRPENTAAISSLQDSQLDKEFRRFKHPNMILGKVTMGGRVSRQELDAAERELERRRQEMVRFYSDQLRLMKKGYNEIDICLEHVRRLQRDLNDL